MIQLIKNAQTERLKFMLKKFQAPNPVTGGEGLQKQKVEGMIEAAWEVFCRYVQMAELCHKMEVMCELIPQMKNR